MQALDFGDPQYVEAVEQRFEEVVSSDAMGDAYALTENLTDYYRTHPDFERSSTALLGRCERLRLRAAWVALPMLSEKEVLNLFKNSMSTMFALPEYNFTLKLRGFIMAIIGLEERDRIKQLFRQAMMENEEPFPTVATGEPSSLPQTMGLWLKHYNTYVNAKIGTSLQRVQYLTQVTGESLSVEQKEQLKQLIQAFDYLKLSSA